MGDRSKKLRVIGHYCPNVFHATDPVGMIVDGRFRYVCPDCARICQPRMAQGERRNGTPWRARKEAEFRKADALRNHHAHRHVSPPTMARDD